MVTFCKSSAVATDLAVQGLLGKEKYFGRPLPRVPVKAGDFRAFGWTTDDNGSPP